jgi:hypothetical protein
LTVQGPLVTVGRLPFHKAHPLSRLLSPLLLAVVLLFGAVTGGCAGAPVQEMSNARQAVKAAERAGAATAAPELMTEARQLLKGAESHLRRGEYRDARDQADLARNKAVEARRIAEEAAPASPP